jgi:tRNA threonylcarbamoyladenosine biosynthesis protein TsaE
MDQPISFLSHSESETLAWARSFAASLSPGDTVALSGDLGAGKTVVSRGIASGLGFAGMVHSPSYALVHEYPGARLPLFHMDLYRLAPGSDWQEIGLDHYLTAGGVCLVEWPERLPESFPFTARIEIGIEGEEARRLTVRRGTGAGKTP